MLLFLSNARPCCCSGNSCQQTSSSHGRQKARPHARCGVDTPAFPSGPLGRPPAAPRSTKRGEIELNSTALPPLTRPRFFFPGDWGEGRAENIIKNSDFRKGEADWRGRFEADSRSIRGRFRRSFFYNVERQWPKESWKSSGLTCSFATRVLTDCPVSPNTTKVLRVPPCRTASFWSDQRLQ